MRAANSRNKGQVMQIPNSHMGEGSILSTLTLNGLPNFFSALPGDMGDGTWSFLHSNRCSTTESYPLPAQYEFQEQWEIILMCFKSYE